MAVTVAADVGGTFTDFAVLDEASGELTVFKVPSTSPDPSIGLLNGFSTIAQTFKMDYEDITVFKHGSTITTNCLILMNGARCGLLTTRGFRDLLELARQKRPKLYDLYADKPEPLIPRMLREEIAERLAFDGSVIAPLSTEDVAAAIKRLVANNVEAVVVVYLHSYANPDHELLTKKLVSETAPQLEVYTSHEILAEFREFERLSTAVINAYVGPIVKKYLSNLTKHLQERGFDGSLLVLKADGGVASPQEAERSAVWTIGSGPSAGVQGAALIARKSLGIEGVQLITLDMGGTSADISLILDGRPVMTGQREVAGWPIKGVAADVQSIGAGGGSIAWVDDGGLLRVGPQSAGSMPGPSCYNNGGLRPTVTDAHVVLGRLETLLGGQMSLRRDLAYRAIEEHIAGPLGLGVEKAAQGILSIVDANMSRAVRLMTIEQGHDPREFALMAYGGAGPLHAATIAESFGIRSVLIPGYPGALSALGVLTSDITKEYSTTKVLALRDESIQVMQDLFRGLVTQAESWLAREKLDRAERRFNYTIDLRYKGQSYELSTPIREPLSSISLLEIIKRFHGLHERTYGFSFTTSELECVTFRVSLSVVTKTELAFRTSFRTSKRSRSQRARRVWFDETAGFVETPIYWKADLGSTEIVGPAIIEQLDATTILSPGQTAKQDEWGNIHLRCRASPSVRP